MGNSWSNTQNTLIILVEEVTGFSGLFGYSPTVGPGNLVFSIAASAGTDPYGNDYPAGLTTYDRTDNLFVNITAGEVNVGPLIGGDVSVPFSGGITSEFPPGGPPVFISTSPTSNTFNSSMLIEQIAGVFGSALGSSNESRVNFIGDASQGTALLAGISGAMVALDPNSASLLSPYTWQTPASFGSGWAIGPSSGIAQPLQYRIDAEDNLIIVGAIHTTSTTPSSVIFNVPAPYRPLITQRSPGVINKSNVASVDFVNVNSNGDVSIFPTQTVTAEDVYFQIAVPLGNIK